VRTIRKGRKTEFLEATLSDGTHDVARAWAVRLRAICVELPPEAAPVAGPNPDPPDIAEVFELSQQDANPFFAGIETRVVSGDLRQPGPALAWFRLRRSIVAGEEPSPLMRVVAVADFASGISSVLDPTAWS
jgi:hypothetical protein